MSFLHGINGSGKTSVLRAMASLLTPDPVWMFNTVFEHVEVMLEHQGAEQKLSATRTGSNAITIRVSGPQELEDTLNPEDMRIVSKVGDDEFFRHVADPDELAHRIRFFNEKVPTFAFVNSLPTPIFLGLDRTTLTPSPQRGPRPTQRSRAIHPYFRTQLDEALIEAERLLTRHISVLSSERNRIFEELRNQFVLSLFQIPELDRTYEFGAPVADPRLFQEMRESVISALLKKLT